MLRKFFKKYSKNPLEKKDNEVFNNLVEQGKDRLHELQAIDQKIVAIQSSTKTTFSFFAPVHNYCRTKYTWYYNWHAKPYATKVHAGVLAAILLSSLVVGGYPLFSRPNLAKAADYVCTWNGPTSGSWYNWSDTTKWLNCNGQYPGQDTSKSYDVSIPAGKRVQLDISSLDLTGGGTTNGDIAVDGHFTNSNHNVTVHSVAISSTGEFIMYGGGETTSVKGNWSNKGIFTPTNSNSTVDFVSSGAQTVDTGPSNPNDGCPGAFDKMKHSGSGTLQIASGGNLDALTTWDITAGTLDSNGQSLGACDSYSDLYVRAGSTLLLGATTTGNLGDIANYGTVNSAMADTSQVFLTGGRAINYNGSMFEYSGSGAVTMLSYGYGGYYQGLDLDHAGSTFTLPSSDPNALNALNVTINSGTLSVPKFYFGSLAIASGGGFTKGVGPYKLFGTGATYTDNTAGGQDLGNVEISSGDTTLSTNAKMTSLTIDAGKTFNISNHTLTLTGTGTPLVNSGAFTTTGSTVIYAGTTTATNIAAVKYNNLTLTPGGATTYSLLGHLNAANSTAMTGSLTINANATLNTMPVATSYNIDCVNITITGIITANNSTLTVSGGFSGSYGTFTAGTSTVIMTGNGNFVGNYYGFYNLTINAPGATVGGTSQFYISHVLDLKAGTVGGLYFFIMNPTTATSFLNEGITYSGTTVRFSSTTATSGNPLMIPATTLTYPYPNLEITAEDAAVRYAKLGGSIYVAGSMMLNGNQTTGNIHLDTDSTNNYSITVTADLNLAIPWRNGVAAQLTLNNSTLAVNGSLNINYGRSAGEATILYGNTGTINVKANWTNYDTFTAGTSTVNFTGTSSQQIITSTTTVNNTFNNLIFNNGTNSNTLTLNPTSGTPSLVTNGLLTITKGNLSPGAYNMTLNGSLTFSDTTNGILTRGAGTLSFYNTGTWTDNRNTKGDLGTVYIGGNLTLGSSVQATSITVGLFYGFNLGAGSNTLTLSGTGTPLILAGGTFNKGTGSTVVYSGWISDVTIAAVQYNNLTLTPSVTIGNNFNLAGPLSGATAMTGNLTINNGANLKTTTSNFNIDCVNVAISTAGILTANASTIKLSGNWDSSAGTFTYGTSTLDFTGPGDMKFKDGSSIYNLKGAYTGNANHFTGAGIWIKNVLTLVGDNTGSIAAGTPAGSFAFSSNDKLSGQIVSSGAIFSSVKTSFYNYSNTDVMIVPSQNITYYAPTLYSGAATGHFQLSGDIVSTDRFQLLGGGGGVNNQQSILDLNGHSINVLYCYVGVLGNNTRTGKIINSSASSDSTITLTSTASYALNVYDGSGNSNGDHNIIDGTGTKTININIAGSWTNSDTFLAGNGAVTFNGGNGITQILNSGGTGVGKNFNNLTHSGAGMLQLSAALAINGNFTNSGGTFDNMSMPISVAGNFTGPFTANGSTVTLDGPNNATITGDNSFNNLSLGSSGSSAGRTINFHTASTQTIGSTLTLAGASGKVLTLGRDGGGSGDHFNLAIHASFTSGQFINVSNSNVTGGTITPGNYGNVVDGGNNTGWAFVHTAPTVSFATTPASPNGNSSWFKGSAPVVTLSAASIGPVVTGILYRFGDSGSFVAYDAGNKPHAPEGTNTMYAYATDEAGNSGLSSPQQSSYKVDTAAPSAVDIYLSPSGATGTNGYYKGTAPTLTFTAVDATSGASTIYYAWDLSDPSDNNLSDFTAYPGSALTSPEGVHTVSYLDTDVAGNKTATFNRTVSVDTIMPTASVSSVSPASPNGAGGYYKGTAPTITLSGNDGSGSGIANIKYRFGDSGSFLTYDGGSKPVAPEGTNTLYYYSVDNAGNDGSASPNHVSYQVDLSVPAFSDSVIPVATTPTNDLKVVFSWPVATDSASGVASYLVTIGSTQGASDIESNAPASSTTFTETFKTVGTYYIRVKAIDNVGYISDYSSEGTVLIDQTNPVIDISNLTDNTFVTTKTINFAGTSSDPIPGVNNVQVQFDGGVWQDATLTNGGSGTSGDSSSLSWSYSWANYTEGPHTLIAKAVDKAGNEKATTTFHLVVDTVAPSNPKDARFFNISNSTASVYGVYLDFAPSTDDTSGVKGYELDRNGTKLADITTVMDTTNPNYTGSALQPYYYVDNNLSAQKYSYTIKATDVAGNVSESPAVVVDTTGKVIETDTITDLKGTPSTVVGVDKTTAQVSWSTVYPATSHVDYGTSTAYGQKVDETALNQGHNILLKDLKPNTTYHAKVSSRDIYGREITSSDVSFTTNIPPVQQSALQVIIDTIQNLFRALTINAAGNTTTGSGVATATSGNIDPSTLQGFSDNLLVTDISFGSKGIYQNIITFPKSTSIQKSSDGKSYSDLSTNSNSYLIDKGLSNATNYYYRLTSSSLPVVRKPLVGDDSELTVTGEGVVKEATLTTQDKVQLSVSWQTNRGAGSQVKFGTSASYGQTTKEDTSLNMGHNVVLENLLPDTTYHFKVTSKDSQGNIAESNDFSFTTPVSQKQKTPIDVIVESLQKLINSLKNLIQ